MLPADRGYGMPKAAKYKILHELGTGGMGKVCKGMLVGQAGFQRPIVIKQLKTRDPHHVQLFVDEARRYAVLDHENIGRIFDFEDVEGEHCIILEHIDGWSLTGKPAYMSPEMVVEMRADNRSDLFSLGAVFHEMLTLRRLFGGASTAEVLEEVVAGEMPSAHDSNPGVTEGVLAILRRALQRDPQERFASAGEMGVACEHYLYDKGYGPTNLTLKRYLQSLFGDTPEGTGEDVASIDPALLALVEDVSLGDPREEDAQEHTRPALHRPPRE